MVAVVERARGATSAADEGPGLGRRGRGAGLLGDATAGRLADRILEILLAGVSTRRYGDVLPEMADTVGVSKSAVSWEAIEASERVLAGLMERRLDAWDLLGHLPGRDPVRGYHVLAAVGVDTDGKKHVLRVREGASENGSRRCSPSTARAAATAQEVPGHDENHRQHPLGHEAEDAQGVTNWKNGAMVLRWAAATFVETEKNYRRIIGHDQLRRSSRRSSRAHEIHVESQPSTRSTSMTSWRA